MPTKKIRKNKKFGSDRSGNRTEALDASRAAVREEKIVLPRRQPIVEEFAQHLTANAKILDENEETGAKKYRYIRTAEDHFSLAFTYAWMATTRNAAHRGLLAFMREQVRNMETDDRDVHLPGPRQLLRR